MAGRFWAVLIAGVLVLILTISSGAFEGIHNTGRGYPKLNYDSLYESAVPINESPEGRKIVARCLDAYGGIDHLNQLASLRLQYTMIVSFSPHPAQVVKYMSVDRRHRTVRQSPGFRKERLLHGDQAWRIIGDSVVQLKGADFYGQLFSYYVLQLPRTIVSDEFDAIKFGRRENDSLAYIYMMMTDTLMLVAGISVDDYTVRSAEGIVRGGDGGAVYVNWFSDYRRVDGYLFPHHLVNISLGLEVGRSTLDEVEVNPDLSDKIFSPKPEVRTAY